MKMFVEAVLVAMLMMLGFGSMEAQKFEISKHDEIKSLDISSEWYIVERLGDESECCNSRRMLGEIVKVTTDSIQLEVTQLETRRTDTEKSYLSKVMFNTKKDFPIYAIAKMDIKNLEEKSGSFSEVLKVSGAVLFFTSLVTGLHGLVVDGDNRKALFLSAGVQMGASLTMIGLGKRNNKYVIHDNAWKFDN